MRKTILTLRDGDCRFPMTDDHPFLFCGEITAHEGTSYCAQHHVVCHAGYGKNVAALAEMIYGIENTIVRRRSSDETPNTLAVDVVVRE